MWSDKIVLKSSIKEKHAIREGLDEESLVLFDLLSKPNLQPKEISKIKEVATTLLSTLKKERLKIANWQQKESTRDAVKLQFFDFLYDEKTGLPVDIYVDEEIKNITEGDFCIYIAPILGYSLRYMKNMLTIINKSR